MSISIQKITNGNVYLDGGSYMGRASEVQLPKVVTKFTEHGGLGLHGTLELPGGLEKMEAKVNWGNVYTEVLAAASNPYAARTIMVRGNAEVFSQTGRVAEFPVVSIMKGFFKGPDGGTYKQNEAVGLETELTCHYLMIKHNGVVIVEVDVFNNIHRANGVDLLANYKINVGT